MAEVYPNEGLGIIIGQWPKADAALDTMCLCLFRSQTASTVITPTQTLSNISEAVFTNYARQALLTASWGAAVAVTGGMQVTYPQVVFPACGATGDTINGFFIGDSTPPAAPTKCIGQSNFSDNLPVALVTLDIIKVTPSIIFGN